MMSNSDNYYRKDNVFDQERGIIMNRHSTFQFEVLVIPTCQEKDRFI